MIRCPSCRRTKTAPIAYLKNGGTLYKCNNCGMEFESLRLVSRDP